MMKIRFLLLCLAFTGCTPKLGFLVTGETDGIGSPCADTEYLRLKTKPIAEMSEREFEIYKIKDAACLQHRSDLIASGNVATAIARQTAVHEQILGVTIFLIVGSVFTYVALTSSEK